jgi:hypothetical protein
MERMTDHRPAYARKVERTAYASGWRDGKKGITPTPARWPNAYNKGYWTAFGFFHAPPLPLKVTCVVSPQRHTSDQYRCGGCGVIWDIDEPRPPCQITGSTKGDTK